MLKSIKITILSLTTPLLLCSAPTTSEQALHVTDTPTPQIPKFSITTILYLLQ